MIFKFEFVNLKLKLKMVDKLDFNDINSMIKEYLKFHNLENTLDSYLAEERTKYYANKNSKTHQVNVVPTVITLKVYYCQIYRINHN